MTGLHNFKGDFVYRALRTDEDPYKIIDCKSPGSERTIDEHVRDGLKYPSKYISTTASFESAREWIGTSAYKSDYKRGTTIVKIDVNYLKRCYPHLVNSAYDFTKEDVRNTFLTGESKKYARKYEEVVFAKYITFCAISDIHVEGRGWIGSEPPRSVPIPIPTPAPPPITTPATLATLPITTPFATPATLATLPITTSFPTYATLPITTPFATLATLPITTPFATPATLPITTPFATYATLPITTPFATYATLPITTPFAPPATLPITTPFPTLLKRSTGVKRSCYINPEVTPAKCARVNNEDILSADNQIGSNDVTLAHDAPLRQRMTLRSLMTKDE